MSIQRLGEEFMEDEHPTMIDLMESFQQKVDLVGFLIHVQIMIPYLKKLHE